MIDSEAIFNIKTEAEFTNLALDIFNFQFENNKIYRSFCDLLYKHPSAVKTIQDIPFLPIQFFKTHKVLSTTEATKAIFRSSGTTGSTRSTHYVSNLEIYRSSFRLGFRYFYGDIKNYVVLALLPSYLERTDSSLVFMVNDFIEQSEHPDSGFYLDNYAELAQKLKQLDAQGEKVLLIGVSFALLDFLDSHKFQLKNTTVMETGGMKGRRKELIREELHKQLKKGFGINTIHSEYGMTELLSQAYSKGQGDFVTPPWMRILIRDTEDALCTLPSGKTGGINVIDLANIDSCSFIATQDLGKINANGSFEILGRFDHADIRGCNLMAL